MSRKFSLAYLTIPGVEAVKQIEIASEAGYDFVSLRTIPMGQPGEPANILEKDPELFKEIKAELKAREMKLLDIELIKVQEEGRHDYRGAFEKGAELGATDVLSSVWTPNYDFAIEELGKICEQAGEFGLTMNLEFPFLSEVKSFQKILEIQDKVAAPNLKILMDMIYCHWDNVTGEAIKKVDPKKFGVIHLCDSPKNEKELEIPHIMRAAREYCGQGAVNIPEIIGALPANNCSIESPNLQYIKEYGALGHAKRCLENAKSLFAEANL